MVEAREGVPESVPGRPEPLWDPAKVPAPHPDPYFEDPYNPDPYG